MCGLSFKSPRLISFSLLVSEERCTGEKSLFFNVGQTLPGGKEMNSDSFLLLWLRTSLNEVAKGRTYISQGLKTHLPFEP